MADGNQRSGPGGPFVAAGGLIGALGVAASAAAAHAGGAFTGTIANMLLFHAPVFLIAGMPGLSRVGRMGGRILLAGLVLFCGDLAVRDQLGSRLFPFAAPAGGMLLIAGWLVIAASALVRTKPSH